MHLQDLLGTEINFHTKISVDDDNDDDDKGNFVDNNSDDVHHNDK